MTICCLVALQIVKAFAWIRGTLSIEGCRHSSYWKCKFNFPVARKLESGGNGSNDWEYALLWNIIIVPQIWYVSIECFQLTKSQNCEGKLVVISLSSIRSFLMDRTRLLSLAVRILQPYFTIKQDNTIMSIGFLKFNHPSSEKLGYLVGFVIALICIALQKKAVLKYEITKLIHA